MSTPHNSANLGDFAKTVIVCGDPMRAKLIAEKYFENSILVNNVRGIQGYTGTYKGIKLSVMAHGMGMPSAGIYTHELFEFYGVENIIRVGSSGALVPDLNLSDIIIATSASSDSNIGQKLLNDKSKTMKCSPTLLKSMKKTAKKLKTNANFCKVFSSDVFYTCPEYKINYNNAKAVEMEIFIIYAEAKHHQKNAISVLTVSDSVFFEKKLTPEERQNNMNSAITLALETAITL